MLFICYPKCSTCQKARKWLEEHGVEYTERHIVEENPTYDELKKWYEMSGLALKKFFNTSGMLYKEMQLKDKLPAMADICSLRLRVVDVGARLEQPVASTDRNIIDMLYPSCFSACLRQFLYCLYL